MQNQTKAENELGALVVWSDPNSFGNKHTQ